MKSPLHPRNRHRDGYDFAALIVAYPALKVFVRPNPYGDLSIDFFNPAGVKALNTALLMAYYGLEFWDIPAGYLCPPIPGRADYLHYLADVLAKDNQGKIPTGAAVKILDIGLGANAIYPIIGHHEYGWSFVASDIDLRALQSATAIVDGNRSLQGHVEPRLQSNPHAIFSGIIHDQEFFNAVVCNPPFHASLAEAQASATRKVQNLKQRRIAKPVLNFGGQSNELWCPGGEVQFVRQMIRQSRDFAKNCRWFSALISKEASLASIDFELQKIGVRANATIPMAQGNKISRLVLWSFEKD